MNGNWNVLFSYAVFHSEINVKYLLYLQLDMQERQKFDEIFERVLSELQPVCLAEQEFCIAFFNLNAAGNEVSIGNSFFLFCNLSDC